MDSDILIAEEVAEILRVDKQRIYWLARHNQIPHIVLGERQYRFSRKAIEQFIFEGGQGGGNDKEGA